MTYGNSEGFLFSGCVFFCFSRNLTWPWWSRHFFPQNIQQKLDRTRTSYEIFGFRGPFSGSCWRFLGNMSQQFSSCLVLLKPSRKATLRREVLKGSYQACRVSLGTWMWGESLHPAKLTARSPQNHRIFLKEMSSSIHLHSWQTFMNLGSKCYIISEGQGVLKRCAGTRV